MLDAEQQCLAQCCVGVVDRIGEQTSGREGRGGGFAGGCFLSGLQDLGVWCAPDHSPGLKVRNRHEVHPSNKPIWRRCRAGCDATAERLMAALVLGSGARARFAHHLVPPIPCPGRAIRTKISTRTSAPLSSRQSPSAATSKGSAKDVSWRHCCMRSCASGKHTRPECASSLLVHVACAPLSRDRPFGWCPQASSSR